MHYVKEKNSLSFQSCRGGKANHGQHDTTSIADYLYRRQLGTEAFKHGDFKTARDYFELMLNDAKKIKNKRFEGDACKNLGLAYHSLGEFKKAMELHQLGLRIAKETGNKDAEGQGYNNLGLTHHSLGEFNKAIERYELSLGIAQNTGNKDAEGTVYNNLGVTYRYLGEFEKAIDLFQLGLSIAINTGNKNAEGIRYNNLGNAYHSLGELKKAIELFQLSLSIAKNTGNKNAEGQGYNNLGAVYLSLGEVMEAMELFQLGLSIAKNTGKKTAEGTAYNNLGEAYNFLGEFKKAIEHFQWGLRIATETGSEDGEGTGYNNLGVVYSSLGEFEKAKELFERGLQIAQNTGNEDAEGTLYINLSYAYHSVGDFEKASKFSKLGLNIAKKTENKGLLGRGYNSLGHVSFSLGDFKKAIEFYKLGLTIAEEAGDKHSEGHGYINFGKAYQSLNDSQKAIEFYQQGLSIMKEIGHKDAESSAYGALACAFRSLDDVSKAEELFKSQVKLVEEMRVLLQEKDEWKISFRNTYDFRELVALQLQQGKIIEALLTAEAGRAQALVDLMESQYGGKKSFQSSFKSQMELTLSNISSHISSPTLFLEEDTCDVYLWLLLKGQQFQFVRKEISVELKTLINQTYTQIGVKGRGRSNNRSPDEPEDEEIDDLTDRGTQASASSSQQDDGGALKTLYEVVIAPISHLIKGDELIIVAHGSSFIIPYAALVDQHSKYLSEMLRVRLAPSLTCLKLLAECPEWRHSTSGALLVGNPWVETVRIDREKLQQLPGAEKEVKMIGQILNIVPLTGKDATKEQVLSRLNPVSLIHIAAHGQTENGEIILSPNRASVDEPEEEDFLLTMADVLGAKLHAKLVVLSCCYSGQGPIKAEGVVGIARAFLGAGARSVIATLWAIDDEATLEFMRHFYGHLVAGQSASKALHQAMKCLRESEQYKAVKHWAPFVLIGDDVTLNFSQ